jgi:hypothetical protein
MNVPIARDTACRHFFGARPRKQQSAGCLVEAKQNDGEANSADAGHAPFIPKKSHGQVGLDPRSIECPRLRSQVVHHDTGTSNRDETNKGNEDLLRTSI